MNGVLRTARTAALIVISVLVAGSTAVAFGESYRALYLWASMHGVPGGWAMVWPAMVDTFTCVGELALFVALTDRWEARSRVFAWTVTLAGLSVSVAANVGHVTAGSFTARATAAVPPVAAAAALAVGLGVLKRVVEAHHKTDAPQQAAPEAVPQADPLLVDAETAFPDVLAGAPVPSLREGAAHPESRPCESTARPGASSADASRRRFHERARTPVTYLKR
jgi:hypothetical protein